MAKNLFVGGLPFTTTEDELNKMFAAVGMVQSVKIITDRYSGSSRGFAFVEMATDNDATKAIEKLNGSSVGSRNIIVKEALPKPTYTNGRSAPDYSNRGGRGYGPRRY